MRLMRWVLGAVLLMPAVALGQLNPGGGVVAGVAITPEGVLQYRQVAPLVPPAPDRKADENVYISLPQVLAQWRAARDAGREVPVEVRLLRGLTQIQSVFVYPQEKDLVIAGPAEPIRGENTLQPLGAITGRPVVQLEDLIVALRAVHGNPGAAGGRRDFFGCSLEQPANFEEAWSTTLERFGRGPRPQLLAEMRKALGPQQVKLFGVPGESRVALTMLAADYRLKRMCMGLEPLPAGMGSALGGVDSAPRFWFEPQYEPLRVSADGCCFEFRGQRLKVLVGAREFDAEGATELQKRFGADLSARMGDMAGRVQAVADLQNVSDCFMLAALIRRDRLAEKAGWEVNWLLEGAAAYPTAALTVPLTAETLVHISGNVIAQGGVAFALRRFSDVPRDTIDRAQLALSAERPQSDWYLAKSAK